MIANELTKQQQEERKAKRRQPAMDTTGENLDNP